MHLLYQIYICSYSNYLRVYLNEQDKSWRVRYMVANQLYELCEAVGPEATRLLFRTQSI